MTEEIRGHLSKIANLRLLSADAVQQYGSGDPHRLISELGVTAYVEGEIRREGDRVRIIPALVEARTRQLLWSEQYDRPRGSILGVEGDVAVEVANALQMSLSPLQRAAVQKPKTSSAEAYDLYLRARTEGLDEPAATGLLQKALALDPRFADPKAHLAYIALMRGYDEARYLDEAIALAHDAAESDPTLGLAHAILGSAYSMKGQDAEARLSFLRALELDPNDTTAMANLSIHDSDFGRLDESLYWARRAFLLSARDGNARYHVGVPLVSLRADDVTERWLLAADRRFPDDPRIQIELGALEFLRGRGADGVARLRAASAKSAGDVGLGAMHADLAWLMQTPDLEEVTADFFARSPDATPGIWWVASTPRARYASVLQRNHESARAGALVREAERVAEKALRTGSRAASLIEFAGLRLMRGDRKAAIDALTRAFDHGARSYGFLAPDPLFAPLRGDPAFRALLERMKADVAAQRARADKRRLLDLDPLLSAQR